jgi:hypothetical protein
MCGLRYRVQRAQTIAAAHGGNSGKVTPKNSGRERLVEDGADDASKGGALAEMRVVTTPQRGHRMSTPLVSVLHTDHAGKQLVNLAAAFGARYRVTREAPDLGNTTSDDGFGLCAALPSCRSQPDNAGAEQYHRCWLRHGGEANGIESRCFPAVVWEAG